MNDCKHYFQKRLGVWLCRCGQRRDKHGKVIR